jgi:hypothetical protein
VGASEGLTGTSSAGQQKGGLSSEALAKEEQGVGVFSPAVAGWAGSASGKRGGVVAGKFFDLELLEGLASDANLWRGNGKVA